MGGTVNMGGKVLYTVIHLYNSCTQYSTHYTLYYSKPIHRCTNSSNLQLKMYLLKMKKLTIGNEIKWKENYGIISL